MQSELHQQLAALASAGESETALSEWACGTKVSILGDIGAPQTSRFISLLVLGAIKLQDQINILTELIERAADEDKLSGE